MGIYRERELKGGMYNNGNKVDKYWENGEEEREGSEQ